MPLLIQYIFIIKHMKTQNKPKTSFKQKISNYFSFFCNGKSDLESSQKDELQKVQRRTSIKAKRISFMLDRALIKMSRKNLCAQEFGNDSKTKELLDTYISTRLKDENFVIFYGKFSDKIMKNPLTSIRIVDIMPSSFTKNNMIYLKPNQHFKLRKTIADILVKQILVSTQEEIQSTLREYHDNMINFIFVKYEKIEISELHELFITFKDLYLFQIQKVMVLEKCYASVIYVTKNRQFLMIDDNSLVGFYMDEMIKKDGLVEKVDFPYMLTQLIQNGLCVEVASTIGELMTSQKYIDQYDKEFIYLMHQRYNKSHGIIEEYLKIIKAESTNISEIHEKVPQFYENTPLFNQEDQSKEDKQKQKKGPKMSFQSVKKSFLSFGIRGDFD